MQAPGNPATGGKQFYVAPFPNAESDAINPSTYSTVGAGLEGDWKAPWPSGHAKRLFPFHVTGNTFTGQMQVPDQISFDNGKIESGKFSFSGKESFYTGVISGDHLDITTDVKRSLRADRVAAK